MRTRAPKTLMQMGVVGALLSYEEHEFVVPDLAAETRVLG